jgi:SAM-dependent methyltransferase
VFHPEGPSFAELVRQALSSTEAGYDLLAPKFDRTPFRTPDSVLEPLARFIGGPGSIDSALDVCCGTGAALRHLIPLCRERAVGVDFSRGMLAEARRRLPDASDAPRVELLHGDVLDLPLAEEMDVVVCVGALGHIRQEDEDRFVASVARALRPGGRFLFVTGPRPATRSPARWLSHAFNAAMRARNALLKPEFVMFYLTFLWPDVEPLLGRHGLRAQALPGLFPRPWHQALLVVAEKARTAPERGP